VSDQLPTVLGEVVDGEIEVENPFWDTVKTIPGDSITAKYDGRWEPDGFQIDRVRDEDYEKLPTRKKLCQQYSWAIPSPDSIAFILKHLEGQPVVEVGAGTGYWAWLLAQTGIDVNAYDANPPSQGWNDYHCPMNEVLHTYTDDERAKHRKQHDSWMELAKLAKSTQILAETTGRVPPPPFYPVYESLPNTAILQRVNGTPGPEYHPVQTGGPEALGLPENQTRVLLLSWPSYDDSFGEDCVRHYQGNTIIYMGEGEGGCCGTDGMFELLNDEWEVVDWCSKHVTWSMIHDRLEIYRRKSISGDLS